MSGWKRKFKRKGWKVSGGATRRMMNDHLDVLQNIEFSLISRWRERDDVDDNACHAAIESLLTSTEPQAEAVSVLTNKLNAVRDMRCDVSDDVWREGLLVVAESIRNHSERRPGEISYLSFVDGYIA